jgi:hypothetical protein
MKKICFYDTHIHGEFKGYWIESPQRHMNLTGLGYRGWRKLLSSGRNGFRRDSSLWFQTYVDELYRDRDPVYMRLVDEFIERYGEYDVLVFGIQCFIHPEILATRLDRPVKILGFVDDPISTYAHGIPCLWAFDGAYYISPAYSDAMSLDELLKLAGCANRFWLPLTSPARRPADLSETFFAARDSSLTYVGNRYGHKLNRLKELKQAFGQDFRVHGRWPLKGWVGPLAAALGSRQFPYRVTSLTQDERTALYWRTKIGFNLHWSQYPTETGNMRMYETALHGMMLLCDKAARNLHEQIFEPDREAVYYDSTADAIDKIHYYLAHEQERLEIARNGFNRAWKDYNWESVLLRLLDWASSLKSNTESSSNSKSGH